MPQVLEQLVELALRRSSLSEAAGFLSQLDMTTVASEVPLKLRWRLIESLMHTGNPEAVLSEAKHYAAHANSKPVEVGTLLRWLLEMEDTSSARQLAKAVTVTLHTDGMVETLRMLCLAPDRLDGGTEAETLMERTQPEFLFPWPSLQCRTYLLRARCAEVLRRWGQMLREAIKALEIVPNADNSRYWHARALLHNDRNKDAQVQLAKSPHQMDQRWSRLSHIAALAVKPEPSGAEACLQVAEGKWGELDFTEASLVLNALQVALCPAVDDQPERLTTIAEFSERANHALGPLPWAEYNLALKEICVDGAFEKAAERLQASVADPEDGCPSCLLRAVCAAVLGRVNSLSQALRNTNSVPSDFAQDHSLMSAVRNTFFRLSGYDGFEHGDPLLNESQNYGSGRLVRSLPVLGAIGALLRELSDDLETPDTPAEGVSLGSLAGAPWAQWLWLRLRLGRASDRQAAAVLGGIELTDLHPALVWECLGWLVELSVTADRSLYSLTSAAFETLKQEHSAAVSPFWQHLIRMRSNLGILDDVSSDADAIRPVGNPQADLCSWWNDDSPLHTLSRQEAEIESCYLNGRYALRRRAFTVSLEYFNCAWQLCGRDETLASSLVRMRYSQVLDYWTGAAMAHLRRFAEAEERFQQCLVGAKATMACIQLGLVSLARGDLGRASDLLGEVQKPWPLCAKYLKALLEIERRNVDEACRILEEAEDTFSSGKTVYSAAAYRLRGIMAESKSNFPGAKEMYRRAMSSWESDYTSAAHLARVWLREAYQSICIGEESIPSEPFSDNVWANIERVEWAKILPRLRELFHVATKHLPSPPDVSEIGSSLRCLDGSALRRLALSALVTAGEPEQASRLAELWDAENSADPYLAAAGVILGHHGDLINFCQSDESDLLRLHSEAVVGIFAAARAKLPTHLGVAFWHDLSRLLFDPTLIEKEELFKDALVNPKRPMSQRAFAAVVNLYADIPARRQRAVALSQQLLEKGAFLEDTAKAAALCLVAFVGGSDEEFLERYAAVEKRLKVLPSHEAKIWIAASQARLRTGAANVVSRGFIPDSLADLAHPEVRQVVGLAYAQLAARAADSDPRVALNHLDQAFELLSSKSEVES